MLVHTPEFLWFLETCIKPRLDEAEEKALDVALPVAFRDIHANVRVVLKEIYDWPVEQFKMAQDRKKVLDKPE